MNLGLVAYVWGALHQDRLLLECLAPAVAEWRAQGLASRFWFDRYDARGPHLFAVLTLPDAGAPAVASRLAARLGEHLAAHPSSQVLTPEQLASRHRQTRGRAQCAADELPGFAANNSFEIFPHPPQGYPFRLSAGLPGADVLWDLVADLTLWTIGRLAGRPGSPATATGLRWIASVARELRLAGARPADYLRHHAATLVPALSEGVGPEEETSALAGLAAGVGSANPALAEAWAEVAATGPVWPGLPRLIRLVLRGGQGGGAEGPPAWALLREIDHAVLKQLGLPVALHIPLALYAWRRSREGES